MRRERNERTWDELFSPLSPSSTVWSVQWVLRSHGLTGSLTFLYSLSFYLYSFLWWHPSALHFSSPELPIPSSIFQHYFVHFHSLLLAHFVLLKQEKKERLGREEGDWRKKKNGCSCHGSAAVVLLLCRSFFRSCYILERIISFTVQYQERRNENCREMKRT